MSKTLFDLRIQKYLKNFSSLKTAQEFLQLDFAVDVKEDNITFKNGSTEKVWIYNYNILRSKGYKKIENEARGLILNANCEIVSVSFPRFFNIHEGAAAALNWNSVRLDTKYDGSLISIYRYKGEIFVQTRNSATASGFIGNTKNTYYEEVVKILKEKNYSDPFFPFKGFGVTGDRYVWVFEYVGPLNRIITPYKNPDLICLTVFRKDLASEVSKYYVDNWAKDNAFTRPKTYGDFKTKSDVIAFVNNNSGPLDEGFVAVDYINNRVKIKSSAYVAVSNMKTAGQNLSPKHFAKIVLVGNVKEVYSYFQDLKDILVLMEEVVEEILEELDDLWYLYKNLDSQKEFSEKVKHHPLCGLLFMARKGKIESFKDIINNIKPEFLVEETKTRYAAAYISGIEKALNWQKKTEHNKEMYITNEAQ